MKYISIAETRAVDPHSFFADLDPAVFLKADPDPVALKCRSGSSLKKFVKNNLTKSFL